MELILFELKNIFLPETIIFFFILINIAVSLFFGKYFYKHSGRIAVLAMIFPLVSIAFGFNHSGYSVFSDTFMQTNFTSIIKILILLGIFLTILLSQTFIKKLRFRAFEYYTLLLISALAAMLLVSANDFISMFVSLELLSVTSTLLIAFDSKYKSKEAGIKYLITSVVASAFLLFGVSYLYGISGETNFSLLSVYYYNQDSSLIFIIATIFVILGLTFKVGCFPFHRWVTEVYNGSPYAIVSYISIVPKLAVFGLLARLLSYIFCENMILQLVISLLAILTVLYGFYGAVKQTNIKKFLSYSSVAHCGFMLLALSVFNNVSYSAFLYYAIVYLFMNFGAWAACLTFVSCAGSDEIKDYQGLFFIRPYYTTAFVVCLIALAGLPPTSGFISKLYLFMTVMRFDGSGFPILLAIMLLTIAGMFAYFKLIKVMFEKPLQHKKYILLQEQVNAKAVLYFCATMLMFTCVFANTIIGITIFASLCI